MLGGTLSHTVLFGLALHVFFHAMHCGIRDHAGDRDRMTDMLAQLDGIAGDLPSAAFRRSELVLIGRIARLKAARDRPHFLVGGFCFVLRSQSSSARNHKQRKKCHCDLEFHP